MVLVRDGWCTSESAGRLLLYCSEKHVGAGQKNNQCPPTVKL